MPLLTPEEALQKRTQLCDEGFCVIPGVMPPELLADMRSWTTDVFEQTEIDERLKYQGSDIHVMPTRAWPVALDESVPMAGGAREYMHHELIERMNDMELQKEAGRLLDLEDLRPGNGNRRWGEPVVQLLSKPPYGPPLYWHQ